MRVLTAAEMGETDRRSVEDYGIPLGNLMDAAGSAVATFCRRRYPLVRRVVVICGKGNNGGDGMVAARVLSGAGLTVRVALLGKAAEVKGEAASALAQLRREAPDVEVLELEDEGELRRVLEWAELLIDAVVGTGFRPPLRGLAAAAREMLIGLAVPVVAVDVPSGWDADSMEQSALGAFRTDAVVTFTAPKLAHVFGYMTTGPVVVAAIGSPDAAVPVGDGLS